MLDGTPFHPYVGAMTPPKLTAAVHQYEREVAPIAARRLTRIAALEAIEIAFWRNCWPSLKDERVRVKLGWFYAKFPVRLLEPLFVSIFGPPPSPKVPDALDAHRDAARHADRAVRAGVSYAWGDHPLG